MNISIHEALQQGNEAFQSGVNFAKDLPREAVFWIFFYSSVSEFCCLRVIAFVIGIEKFL